MNAIRNHFRNRAGIALLMVLIALCIISATTVGLVRLASSQHGAAVAVTNDQIANDLLLACDRPLMHWLGHESQNVVLAPDSLVPERSVLCDRIAFSNRSIDLRVTAFDQQGMLPLRFAAAGSPLRDSVPAESLQGINVAVINSKTQSGLDALNSRAGRIYPQASPVSSTSFSDGSSIVPDSALPSAHLPEHDRTNAAAALGALVGTHHPPVALSQGPPAINISTAPIALVEQAMRALGVDALAGVIDARSEGRQPAVPPTGSTSGPQSARSVVLVNQSSSWSFRIDIAIGTFHRSWWIVYCKCGSTWECLQRLAIVE